MDYQKRMESGLRQQADEEAMDQTTLELGPWPEDPTHYALKPALGGLVLILLTSTILGVEPDGLQAMVLIGILGGLYWVLHKLQTDRRREWQRVSERYRDAALRRKREETK